MQERMAPPENDGYDYDPETFERVWQRVMARPEDGHTRPAPPPEGPAGGPPTISRPPRPQEDDEAAQLRRMMDGEAEDDRFYRALAARAPERMARTLRAVAGEERRHERRLNAAYFILTGRRYRSPNHSGRRPAPRLADGLREQYIGERRGAEAYRRAAGRTEEPALHRLYEELAQDETRHSQMMRSLLEQM